MIIKDLKKYEIENDHIKYEVIENPNYHCNAYKKEEKNE